MSRPRGYHRSIDRLGGGAALLRAPANSRRAARSQHWGLKRRANETARREHVAEVAPLIEGLGLTVPDLASDRHFV